MEQFEIERKETRITYLIKDTGLEFYLLIPNNKKISIVLNIIENVNNEIVKKIPDILDKVLVIPVLNGNIINYLKSNLPSFEQADNYFSNLINTSYKILTHNNIVVDPLVYMNNNYLYTSFNNYFVNKFNGRISLITLNLEPIREISPINNIQSPVVEEKKEVINELDNIYNEEIVLKENNEIPKEKNKKEPGFVSYVLLGVIIAIVSLVFLYMLL